MAIEARRGCGYRKVGGLYLVSGQLGEHCHRLPVPLHVCPTCNQGIKQSRGWQWVSKALLAPDCAVAAPCQGGIDHLERCPLCNTNYLPEKVGLVWIGEKFYKTPQHFMKESVELGISRRIKTVPRGFKVGESWVLLAHPKSCEDHSIPDRLAWSPGIFTLFKPTRIEILVKQSEATEAKMADLAERGLTPILIPDDDKDHQGSVYDKDDDGEVEGD